MQSLHNPTKQPRGVYSASGEVVTIPPGQTVDVELTPGELEALKKDSPLRVLDVKQEAKSEPEKKPEQGKK